MPLPWPFWGLNSLSQGRKCLKNHQPSPHPFSLLEARLGSGVRGPCLPLRPCQYSLSGLSALAGQWNFVLILESHLCLAQ